MSVSMATAIPMVMLAFAAALFMWRLLIGPTVADRVVALDGLLAVVLGGILVAAADRNTSVSIIAVLLVALVGFVATGVLARYVERRGG
jgi:multisubunit Na+/H+ antiporter MnhF subunit